MVGAATHSSLSVARSLNDLLHHASARMSKRLPANSLRSASLNWQPYSYPQPLWNTIYKLDTSTVQVDNAARNRETQAETAGIRTASHIESVEGIKSFFFFLVRYARRVVINAD